MRPPKNINFDTAPVHLGLLTTYTFVCIIGTILMTTDGEFLRSLVFRGTSLVSLLMVVNYLFIGYVVLSMIGLFTNRKIPGVQRIMRSVPFVMALAALIILHVAYVNSKRPEAVPMYVVFGYTEDDVDVDEFRVEDVGLPRADSAGKFYPPQEKRIMIHVQRQGHVVFEKRNHGLWDRASREIRVYLADETSSCGRFGDGTSKVDLLIRCDREAQFRHVGHLIDLCRSLDIMIPRVELGCHDGTIMWIANDPYGPWRRLAEKKLDLLLLDTRGKKARNSKGPANELSIEVRRDRERREGYFVKMNDRTFGGPDVLRRVYEQAKAQKAHAGWLKITIGYDDDVLHGHVMAVLNECYRARAEEYAFERITPDE